jgi:GNAT superfamily N-acetyltransferase
MTTDGAPITARGTSDTARGTSEDAAVTVEPMGTPESAALLWAYWTELTSRHLGRDATEPEIAATAAEYTSPHLVPPRGAWLVVRLEGRVVGGIGLRELEPGVGEVKHMYVLPESRRRGIGRRLMVAVEDAALRRGLHSLRLDTRRDLLEAIALYASQGYAERPPFTSGEYVDHWFEKHLG